MLNFLKKPKLPSSFDIVGSILIINEKIQKQKKVAKLLLKKHKNIKTILVKTKQYQGKYRTPTLKHLKGIKTKITYHRESKCIFHLNVEKCYFSVRSGSERLRIAKQVKPNENILTLFSGVAPFPLIIAKNAKPKHIDAIEINPIAHKYAKENLKINKTTNITLYNQDVKKILPNLKTYNRIIMPLPKEAHLYLKEAKKHLKPKGTIHLYLFEREENFKNLINKYKKQFKTVKLTKAGKYAPSTYRICLDLKA